MAPDTASSDTGALRRAAANWRRLPWYWHLAATVTLGLLALARWPFLRSPVPLGDEAVYLQAFETLRAGGTPYNVKGFFYPLAFARGGAWLLDAMGPSGTLVALRGANLLGLAFAFWTATAWLPLSTTRRWLAAAALLSLSPAVHAGLDLGNVSFFIVGLALAGLLGWPRRPLLAGTLLGTSVALKPIAAAAIPLLMVHRARWSLRDGRRHLVAAVTAAAVAAVLLLPISGLREMLGQEMVPLAHARSFSLQRLLALFGIDVTQVVLTLAAMATAVAAARWRPMSSSQLLCYVVATISLATPLVWNHTLIVALPVQGLALALAGRRSATADGRITTRRRLELACVVLGVAMMHAGTTAGFDHLGPLVQAALLLAVGLTPAAVCAYAFRLTEDLEVPAADDRSRPRDR